LERFLTEYLVKIGREKTTEGRKRSPGRAPSLHGQLVSGAKTAPLGLDSKQGFVEQQDAKDQFDVMESASILL